MTRYYLVAALCIAVFGCDSTTSQNADDIEDLFSANKALTESVINRRNAYCIANPEYSRCSWWCASPEANCGEGGATIEDVKADFQHTKISSRTVSFSNMSENAEYYLWDFGDGSKTGIEEPTHTFPSDGEYTVALTATGGGKTDTHSKQVMVTEEQANPPVASFSYSASDLSVSFTGTSQNAESSAWDFGDGNSSSDTNPSHTYAAAGSYQVALTVSNADGSDTATESVTVTASDPEPVPPVASFSYTTSDLNVSFSNTSSNADASSWDFGDGNASSDSAPSHTYASAGTYQVSLSVSNSDGSDSVTQSVTVSSGNPDPGPDGIPTDRTDLGGSGWNNDIPDPPPGIIVFTGYSNSSQSANTFLGQFAGTYNNYTFVSCAQGGSALENWVNNDMVASCSVSNPNDVVLTVNMIATQSAMDAATSASTIASMVPQLDADLKATFPNAIHAFYGGEPAHFVEPSKCPRICEPIRKLASDWAGAAALSSGSYLGPYLWAGDGIPNAHGFVYDINDYLNPSGGYANQHPSENGRLKVAQQYDIWFRENGIN
ncbi:MAG: PKD domain-containing protein [Rhodothermales bacterium]|nr:PKD domain-containing protein [Rhodothermales bacterium]